MLKILLGSRVTRVYPANSHKEGVRFRERFALGNVAWLANSSAIHHAPMRFLEKKENRVNERWQRQ